MPLKRSSVHSLVRPVAHNNTAFAFLEHSVACFETTWINQCVHVQLTRYSSSICVRMSCDASEQCVWSFSDWCFVTKSWIFPLSATKRTFFSAKRTKITLKEHYFQRKELSSTDKNVLLRKELNGKERSLRGKERRGGTGNPKRCVFRFWKNKNKGETKSRLGCFCPGLERVAWGIHRQE